MTNPQAGTPQKPVRRWWQQLSKIKKIGLATSISLGSLLVAIIALYPAFGSYSIARRGELKAGGTTTPTAVPTSVSHSPSAAAPTASSPAPTASGPALAGDKHRPVEETVKPAKTSAEPSRTAVPTHAGAPVELTGEHSGDRTVTVRAETYHPAGGSDRFWLMLEVHDVSGTHSEFYPRRRLATGPGTEQFDLSVPPDADLTRTRTARVVEVPADVDADFRSNRPDPAHPDNDFLLVAPCCAVSNEITLRFG